MAEELKSLVCASGAPDDFADFLIGEGLSSIADLATAVTSEANVDVELIPAYEATLKDGAKAPFRVKAKVRQAWLAARKSIATANAPVATQGSGSSESYTLPAGTEARLLASWVKAYGFNLPGTYLTDLKCIGKMYKGFHGEKRTMYVPVMSEIKLKSALPTTEVTGTMISGSSIYEVSSPVARSSINPAEFFLLVRAWFTTWAYISTSETGWFDYETCVSFVESLYTFVFMRHDQRQPTIAGLTKAFLCTLADMATEVQNHSTPLGEMVRNRAFWNHYWKDIEFVGGARSGASSSVGAELALTQLPTDVQRTVNADERVTDALRSSLDRVNSALQTFNPGQKGGGRRGRGRFNNKGGNGNANNANNQNNTNANGGGGGGGGGNANRKVTDGGKQNKKQRFRSR